MSTRTEHRLDYLQWVILGNEEQDAPFDYVVHDPSAWRGFLRGVFFSIHYLPLLLGGGEEDMHKVLAALEEMGRDQLQPEIVDRARAASIRLRSGLLGPPKAGEQSDSSGSLGGLFIQDLRKGPIRA